MAKQEICIQQWLETERRNRRPNQKQDVHCKGREDVTKTPDITCRSSSSDCVVLDSFALHNSPKSIDILRATEFRLGNVTERPGLRNTKRMLFERDITMYIQPNYRPPAIPRSVEVEHKRKNSGKISPHVRAYALYTHPRARHIFPRQGKPHTFPSRSPPSAPPMPLECTRTLLLLLSLLVGGTVVSRII